MNTYIYIYVCHLYETNMSLSKQQYVYTCKLTYVVTYLSYIFHQQIKVEKIDSSLIIRNEIRALF